MPYNTILEEQIAEIIVPWEGMEKKKMFGGICYLLYGNICFGIYKDYLIVRMTADLAAEKLKERNVEEFDITGRPMKGWVMVKKSAWKSNDQLTKWLDIGRSYALTLPKKSPRKKSLEDVFYRTRR